MVLPEPIDQISPERAVPLPYQKGWRTPVGSAIGSEDRTAPAADVAHRNEWVIVDAREHLRVDPSRRTVVTQELGPVGEALDDGVVRLDNRRRDPLRAFTPIVIRKQFNGQHVFDGTALVIAFGLDPLER